MEKITVVLTSEGAGKYNEAIKGIPYSDEIYTEKQPGEIVEMYFWDTILIFASRQTYWAMCDKFNIADRKEIQDAEEQTSRINTCVKCKKRQSITTGKKGYIIQG